MYTVEYNNNLSKCYRNDMVEKGFIGLDDKHHKYEYDKSDHEWHSHMTNEEWLEKNNVKQLAACQKCSLWEKCRKHEHTILDENGVSEKLVEELSREINKRIVEKIKIQKSL